MYPQHTNLSHPTSNPPKTTPNSQSTSTNNSLHPRVHYPVGREHLLHQLVLQMRQPHKHHHRHLQTHHINQKSLHTHSTPHQAHTDNI